MHELYQKFQVGLEALRRCDAGSGWPHVFLPREDYYRLACIWEESLPSKAVCLREARQHLQAQYDETERRMRVYTDPCSANSFLTAFKSSVSRRLSSLRDTLGQCQAESTAVSRIMPLLTEGTLFAAMETVNEELCTRYALRPFKHYISQIAYSTWNPGEFDTGLAKLVALAFVRHGYDLLAALQALEADATALLQSFQEDFDTRAALEIERHIVAPIQNELPLLRNTAERRESHA